ncbi:MAG: deoxyhypusine synthase [archaeon]|jgi:deoxyhypusine synthase
MDKEKSIKGMELTPKMSVTDLVNGMDTFGLQASNLSKALKILKNMKKDKSTVFLTFTSNMVSSGMREIFAQMAREKLVDVIITTVGSVEEDFIKSEKSFLLGSFDLDDKELNDKGINRIGNILVPNDRYEWFEKKIQPILKEMYLEKKIWAPVDITKRLGEKLNDKNSFLYWCAKNNIPVFCQAMLDGAFGLQIYFFKQDHKDFVIDDTAEEKLSRIVLDAEKTGAIVLGGGVAKHHTIGVNLLRGGLDYAIYINSTDPFDGSLSGARTNEAISWNKINKEANHVSVQGDASILFPLILAAYLEK